MGGGMLNWLERWQLQVVLDAQWAGTSAGELKKMENLVWHEWRLWVW
jgi:hypothetical protein